MLCLLNDEYSVTYNFALRRQGDDEPEKTADIL